MTLLEINLLIGAALGVALLVLIITLAFLLIWPLVELHNEQVREHNERMAKREEDSP